MVWLAEVGARRAEEVGAGSDGEACGPALNLRHLIEVLDRYQVEYLIVVGAATWMTVTPGSNGSSRRHAVPPCSGRAPVTRRAAPLIDASGHLIVVTRLVASALAWSTGWRHAPFTRGNSSRWSWNPPLNVAPASDTSLRASMLTNASPWERRNRHASGVIA